MGSVELLVQDVFVVRAQQRDLAQHHVGGREVREPRQSC